MALLHINFHSNVLKMDTGISVIYPESMQGIGLVGKSSSRELPVLWLLHGRSDDHTIWMRRTSIERYAAPLGLMVVMPEVSYSRYMNMAYGPRYQDFITQELYDFCCRLFPNMSRMRENHYIAGLSMGGGGAMMLGLRKAEQYGHICMLSTGGVAPLEHTWRSKGGQDTNYRKLNLDIYGTEDSDSLEGTEYDVLKLIRDTATSGKPLPTVFHAMGTEDVRYPVAIAIKETFEGIPGNPYHYEYHEGPGAHEWVFWDEWIRHFLESVFGQEVK